MLSPEGKSDKTYDGGGETQKAEWIVTHAKVSEIWQILLINFKCHLNKNESSMVMIVGEDDI